MFYFFKAMHLISMVAWFAGLFYMFRLFVYHVENADKPDATAMLKVMERKLYYYITTPAMIATIIFGFALAFKTSYHFSESWFHLKLLLIIGLVAYHFFIGHTLKKFLKDDIQLSSKQCRMLNEVPTLFLISIIFIAVYRSFI